MCYLNSKGTRKKLVRALFAVPRTALELVPYYSRLAATLASVMKDVAPMLVAMLEEEFNFLLPKKVRRTISGVEVHALGEFASLVLFNLVHVPRLPANEFLVFRLSRLKVSFFSSLYLCC